MQQEVKYYLLLMTLHNFATGLSNIFISIFIWNLDQSITTLAIYNLVYSLAVLVSFPLCAWYGRRFSPMGSLRLGVLFFIASYGLVLLYQERSVHHIVQIAGLTGLGVSFFVVGQHMQTLDSTEDQSRDRFLYVVNFLVSATGTVAPFLSGYLIDCYVGRGGFYLVFLISLIWFALTMLVSFKLKGKKVPTKSHLLKVWKHPSQQWRRMFWISMGISLVEGTYSSFLVTIMTYSILKTELSLGGYATVVSCVSLLTSVLLAKISSPNRRVAIFSVGAFLVSISSIWLSLQPTLVVLGAYALLSAIGLNLIYTTFNAWTYASFEEDPHFDERRLDYVVIREIPLGAGRIIGISLFLLMKSFLTAVHLLPISFAVFGSVFVCLIPFLSKVESKRISIG